MTKPSVPPGLEIHERLARLESIVTHLQPANEPADNWVPTFPYFNNSVYPTIFSSNATWAALAQAKVGFVGQDVLEVFQYTFLISGSSNHDYRITTSDGLYTLTDSNRGGNGTHRLRWRHPYRVHIDDNRYQPGSTTTLRLAPPEYLLFEAKVVSGGTATWGCFNTQCRFSSFEILTDATTAGAWAYV